MGAIARSKSFKDDVVISVKDIKKSFRIYFDKGTSLKEKILFKNRNKYVNHQVLDGVSFEVKKGEAIGLIGSNGCGKSTTLKMLSQIMYPDSGSIEMKGRVSALIELGAGFHPDMSGRENIYTNASIFGLSKKEVDLCIDDIIAFSELGEFIDNPVRTYSSGMYMRLAFSVAINVKADILLVDEILAVGDAAFQAKCFNKMREIKANGTTIVIVSHALSQIEQICERSIWIKDGHIKMEGIPREVHAEYMKFMSEKTEEAYQAEEERAKAAKEAKESKDTEEVSSNSEENKPSEETTEAVSENKNRWGSNEAVFTQIRLLNSAGDECDVFESGDDLTIEISYEAKRKIDDAVVGLAVYRNDQLHVYGTNTLIDHEGSVTLEGKGVMYLKLKHLPLLANKYTIDLAFHKPDGFAYDFWRDICSFRVKSNTEDVGSTRIEHEWILKDCK